MPIGVTRYSRPLVPCMSKDNAYLADILREAKAIATFVVGITKEQFLANEEKYEAVNGAHL